MSVVVVFVIGVWWCGDVVTWWSEKSWSCGIVGCVVVWCDRLWGSVIRLLMWSFPCQSSVDVVVVCVVVEIVVMVIGRFCLVGLVVVGDNVGAKSQAESLGVECCCCRALLV